MAYKKICGIYKITNVANGKVYVGQSGNIKRRWSEHKLRLNKQRSIKNQHLQNAWNKYGENNFIFDILEECKEEELNEREQYWLDFYKSYEEEKGYNILKNSRNNIGYKHTPETIQKMKDARKRNKHLYINKKLPDSTKQKMSESHKGYVRTEEHQKKLNESRKAETHSKLSEKQVIEIFFRYQKGDISQLELAKLYGVTRGCVEGIVSFHTWKHLNLISRINNGKTE